MSRQQGGPVEDMVLGQAMGGSLCHVPPPAVSQNHEGSAHLAEMTS